MMGNFFKQVLWSWDRHDFSVMHLLFVLAVFIIAVSVYLLIRKFIYKRFAAKEFSIHFRTFIVGTIGWIITMVAILFAIHIIGIPVSKVLDFVIYSNGEKVRITITNVITAILIYFFVRIFLFFIEYFLNKRVIGSKVDKGRGHSLMLIVKYLVWVIGGSIIFSSLGFQITFLIASISALLVGIGFGLQGIFNDILSGIIILFDGSIEVDDVVELEGIVGKVIRIGIRVSEILTRDNVVIIIPNSKFTSDKVINWTHNDESTRFNVEIGVAYGSDVRLVEKLLLECAASHSQIEKTPAPFVRFNNFGESSLDFQLFFWTVNDFRVENIKSDLRFEIDARFRENKVEIPFPQRDIHLKSKNY